MEALGAKQIYWQERRGWDVELSAMKGRLTPVVGRFQKQKFWWQTKRGYSLLLALHLSSHSGPFFTLPKVCCCTPPSKITVRSMTAAAAACCLCTATKTVTWRHDYGSVRKAFDMEVHKLNCFLRGTSIKRKIICMAASYCKVRHTSEGIEIFSVWAI